MGTKQNIRDPHQKYYLNNTKYSYFLDAQDRAIFAKYTDIVRRFSTRGDIILDVGCGTGIFLEMAKHIMPDRIFHGVEVSASSVNICISKGLKCSLYNGSYIPYDDERFTVVGSINVLEHVDNPNTFLQEQLRVLKKHGFLFVICPNFLSITNSYHYHTKGLTQKLRNIISLVRKLFSKTHKWEKMKTIERDEFRPDDDACNLTNPVDILKWAQKSHLVLKFWSSQVVYRGTLLTLIDFSFIRFFFGSSFMVFQKV